LPNWFIRRRGIAIEDRFRRRRHRLGDPAAVGAAHDRADRLARLHRDGHHDPVVLAPINLLLRKRPEDIGLQPDGDAAPSAASVKPPSNVVDPVWVGIDWTLRRALALRVSGGSRRLFLRPCIWYAVQVHQTKFLLDIGFSPNVAVWAALGVVSLLVPGRSGSGTSPIGVGREWCGRSAAAASRSASPA
jgi:hypothetical protein